LNIRRKNPNRFPKVFKNSDHIIIYFLFFILLFYDIYIYISPTNFRSYTYSQPPALGKKTASSSQQRSAKSCHP
jgi:hypothetical protein